MKDTKNHESPCPPVLIRGSAAELNEHAKQAARITYIGALVNTVLLIAKFTAGILGNSQAMIADAVHTVSDFATDLAVLIGIRFSKKPQDTDHAYGHGKYETIAATAVGLALLLVGLMIGRDAIHTFVHAASGQPIARPSQIAFWAALVSIVSKELLYQKTLRVGRRIQSDAVIANAWHHRSDALSSIGTAVGIGMATFLGAEWAIMDPVAAILVSVLLLKVAFMIVKEQVGCLTERALPEEIHQEIEEISLSFPDISYPHNLRTRTVGKTIVIDLHVRMKPDMRVADAHAIVSDLEQKFRERFGEDTIATVHIEPLKNAHAQKGMQP
jgi:cation diffusion facilitator family transporter